MKNLVVIEAPSNLGLIEPQPGKEPGVKELPVWLYANGFYDLLLPERIIKIPAPAYSMELDVDSGVRNAEAIADYSIQLAKQIKPLLDSAHFPLVIGGDCSILIGCAYGFKQAGNFGLFFLDGHTDYVLPYSSDTKGAAGMDLAIVTGNGHEKLTNINGLRPYVREENVTAFGNREYDEDYVKAIKDSDINYYDLNSIRLTGVKSITDNFLAEMKRKETDGFWIHLDVDILDNDEMPCVDSPQPGGLTYAELKEVLSNLFESRLVRGMDITILDPTLDFKGTHTKKFIKEITATLNQFKILD